MILVRNLLITVLVLYCCYMIFKISSKAGSFFFPLLFVLPPLIFRGKKASEDNESWCEHRKFAMSEEAGVIYILSNPAMPGLVKLGKTTNLPARLKSLYGTGVPVPFHCVFAKRVGNYHEVERKLHAGLRSHRENENREFFRISEEEVINFLELIPGEEVTPTEDFFESVEDKAAFEKTSRIGQRFNFDFVEIPRGAVLEFLRDSSYTCIVRSKNKVEYEGEWHTLSSAGLKVMNEHLGFSWASLAGPLNWKYEGEVLDQRRQRFEEVEWNTRSHWLNIANTAAFLNVTSTPAEPVILKPSK